jgi:hypothetical protein
MKFHTKRFAAIVTTACRVPENVDLSFGRRCPVFHRYFNKKARKRQVGWRFWVKNRQNARGEVCQTSPALCGTAVLGMNTSDASIEINAGNRDATVIGGIRPPVVPGMKTHRAYNGRKRAASVVRSNPAPIVLHCANALRDIPDSIIIMVGIDMFIGNHFGEGEGTG